MSARRIRRLPPELANQIAAGEVVERPASVIKELVENALDADARRIVVDVELGGKRSMWVEDDGVGMTAEDAVLALERHATSKIVRAEDLAAILTLGFRGEALPSIASVSHLTLRTRARGTPVGVELQAHAGVLGGAREVGTPEGTIVEVADLFYNLPARRKFLKADSAESAQISRLVTQLALGYPEVGFTLTSSGRRVLQTPPVRDFRERFYQLYGERTELVEVHRDTGGLRITGFVAPPGEQGPVRGPQNIFVNRRIVRDKTISHAVMAAYGAATIKERSPEVHLFIEMPADRVDVNVHPTKAEVRFLEQSFVHESIRYALADALGTRPAASGSYELKSPTDSVSPVVPLAGTLPGVLSGLAALRRSDAPWEAEGSVGAVAVTAVLQPAEDLAAMVRGATHLSPGALAQQTQIDAVRPMSLLGQFRHTYIIAVDADGICIIDQHVAHERVLFEQVLERLAQRAVPSQRLLHPLIIDLASAQQEALRAHAADLTQLGFEVEDFGGGSLRIAAIPAILGVDAAAAAVRALAEDLEGFDRGGRVDDALKHLAATTACHAAVKANQPLGPEKMQQILDELRRTAYSSVCPHGRPVVLRLTRREIEKNFQRI